MSKSLFFLLLVPFFFIGWFYNTPDHIPCVPWKAVDYNGTTNYWYDSSGNTVMYSPEEDTYERCKDS